MSASTFPVAAEGSLVEGLLRAVTLAPELVQDLNRIGVDPHRLESRYRVDTWARAIEVVRSHVYPTLSLEEGNRRLGFDFSHGFSTTIGGRLVLAVVPFLKPATLLARMPRFFKLGRADLVASWVQRSANSGTLRIVDQAQVSPSFDIGLIQYILERVGAKATTTVEWHSLTEFSIPLIIGTTAPPVRRQARSRRSPPQKFGRGELPNVRSPRWVLRRGEPLPIWSHDDRAVAYGARS